MKRLIILCMILLGMLLLFSEGVHAANSAAQTEASARYIAIKNYIVRKTDGSGGLPISDLESVLRYTNTLFAPGNIQFYLLETEYINNSELYELEMAEREGLYSTYNVPNTINIYFVKSYENYSWSWFSSSEQSIVGAVIDQDYMKGDVLGDSYPEVLARMFGLSPTYGSENELTDELVNGTNCDTSGDDICDTPADPYTSQGGSIFSSNCEYTGALTDTNGDSYTPLTDNIMSQTYYVCADKFTDGQLAKVNETLDNYWLDLQSYTETAFASFRANERPWVFSGDEVQFYDLSLDATSWSWTFEGGSPNSSTDENPVVTYTTPGQYDVTLTITDSNDNEKTLLFPDYIIADPFDISFFTPEDWEAPVRFYKLDIDGETKIYQNEFTAGDNVFMDYGVINNGINNAIDSTFRVNIYVNNELKRWNTFLLSARSTSTREEIDLGLVPPGENEIRIEYDPEKDYPEFNETNNTYVTTLSVSEVEEIENQSGSPVVGIEYFIDTEVAFGAGTFIATPANTLDTEINVSIPMSDLSPGLHYLYTRAKNQAGKWGQTSKRNFYVIPTENPEITYSEYFFDIDPGYGQGTALSLSDGENNHVIELTNVSNGYHRLFVRSKNAMGRWSSTQNISFMKVGKKLNPKIKRLSYRYYNYATETYSDYIDYLFDPAISESTAILVLDNSNLISGTQYALGVYAYDENGRRSRIAWEYFTYQETNLIHINEINTTDVLCFGDNTGSTAVTATGGEGALQYSTDGITFSSSTTFENLPAGEYTLYVRGDVEGYQEEASFSISQPNALGLSIDQVEEPNCSNTANGSIAVSAFGGVGSYTFSIDGLNFEESSSFTELPEGQYSIKVKDSNGCTSELGYLLNSQEASTAPSIVINSTQSTLNLTNQFASYQWYFNEAIIEGEISSALITDTSGDYFVQVETESGCTFYSDTVVIQNLVVPNQAFSVDENSENGTVCGVLEYEGIGNDLPSFTILSGNINGAFTIDNETSQLVVASSSALDFESNPTFTLTVEVTGGNWGSAQCTITITLGNLNEPPTIAANQTFSLDENSSNGFSLGTVMATDPENDAISFLITSGNIDDAFALNSTSGEISVSNTSVLDFENIQIFNLGVEVKDGAGGTATGTVVIELNDLDENQSPSFENLTLTVPEHSPQGALVGTFSGSDPDGDILNYSYVIPPAGITPFSIDFSTQQITINDSSTVNYELGNNSYEYYVKATDPDGATATATITVLITDINDLPILDDITVTMDENPDDERVTITYLEASDEDHLWDELTYTITSGNVEDAFTLAPFGTSFALVCLDPSILDFELYPTFEFAISVEDADGGLTQSTVSLEINNIDETALTTSTFEIPENSTTGTVIGPVGYFEDGSDFFPFISTNNLDQSDIAFLRGVELLNAGAIELSAGTYDLILSASEALDFEAFTQFKLKIALCCFTAGQEPTAIITVNISNVNESPTVEDASFTIDENGANGTIIGTIQASDPDGDALSYSIISGNTDDAFVLNSTTGELSVGSATALDFETNPNFSLEVEVADGMGATAIGVIAIELNDLDEQEPLSMNVNEDMYSIYPNPANRELFVNIHKPNTSTAITIHDLSGQIVFKGIANSGINNIDISAMVIGTYIVKIGEQTFKIVKLN